MNKLSTFIGAAALLATGSASAVVVEGVDFGAAGALNHIETTTLAETFVNGDGQALMGYGQINTVNGNSNYAAGGQLLYFTFDYTTQNFTPTSTGFTGGNINIYLGSLGNLLNQDSATNVANIEGLNGGTPWAVLAGHAFTPAGDTLTANGALTGATLSFTGQGLLDVVGGLAAVQTFLDANTIGDTQGGLADIALTTSANNLVLNPFDDTTGCQDGTANVGQWCLAGSADIRGNTVVGVPEPSIIALLGVGMLGFGASLRKNK